MATSGTTKWNDARRQPLCSFSKQQRKNLGHVSPVKKEQKASAYLINTCELIALSCAQPLHVTQYSE